MNLGEEDQGEDEEPMDKQEQKLRDIERALRLTVMPKQVMTKQERVWFLNIFYVITMVTVREPLPVGTCDFADRELLIQSYPGNSMCPD